MIITETSLEGVYIIDIEKIIDHRGFFARSWCKDELSALGLSHDLVQCNISFNNKKGTLRGIHYQVFPFQETKIVRCVKGEMIDIIVDLRPDSKTYTQWISIHLSAQSYRAVYIPKGFGHGLQTLEDNTEIFYHMSEYHHPESSRGVRWNDPTLNIDWPLEVSVISTKDQNLPLLRDPNQ